jgi:hypothetical protein
MRRRVDCGFYAVLLDDEEIRAFGLDPDALVSDTSPKAYYFSPVTTRACSWWTDAVAWLSLRGR